MEAPSEGPTSQPGESTLPATRGIPLTRLADTFDSFDLSLNPTMEPARDRSRAVATGEEWCALLSGAFGNGKTHLAIAALNRRGSGYFWKVPAFLAWIRRSVFDEGYKIEEIMAGYREGNGLIVFDDLGTENPTDWACEQLYLVLDSRYDLKLPTIITTNRDMGRLDPRILSRYRSGLVVCAGKDVRALG